MPQLYAANTCRVSALQVHSLSLATSPRRLPSSAFSFVGDVGGSQLLQLTTKTSPRLLGCCISVQMELQSPLLSLPLPPLLSACLDFGDFPQVLTGTVSKPEHPDASYSLLSDEAEAGAVSIDVINHAERDFWGLRFSGAIIALPPSAPALEPSIPCDSPHLFAAIPHGPCVWLRYDLTSHPSTPPPLTPKQPLCASTR